MHWRVRQEQVTGRAHVYLTIFVAESRDATHANVGKICLEPEEADEFIALLKAELIKSPYSATRPRLTSISEM